jgi:hypothetical protein
MAIQWDLARIPDFVGNALQAQDQGRERGMQMERRNALQEYARNPQGGTQRLMASDPGLAMRFQDQERQTANDARDMQRRTVIEGRQDTEYNQGQQDRTRELLGRYGLWAQRGGAASNPQMAAYWKSLGVPDELIANPDPAQLEALVYGARDVESVIDDTQQPRAPVGYMWSEDGTLTFVPGGPADPATIGRTSGVRREAVTSRPMPRAASSAAGLPPPPAGWVPVGR